MKDASAIARSTASCWEMSSRLEAQVLETTSVKSSSTPRISARPHRLSRRSFRAAGVAAGGRPSLGSGGVPALVDTVGPQEEVPDEARHEDEDQPPEPPHVVRPPLEELDHR